MTDCDKCGTHRLGKYVLYSYYNRFGVSTDVLFRYCVECKNTLIMFYGINESYFAKPENEEEKNEAEKEYWSVDHEVRTILWNMNQDGVKEWKKKISKQNSTNTNKD